ncbi:hypothetical protein RhiirA4_461656 [Rhizophagus irregularis]|uniref:Uncharacterized protein n=1 Tax=Rhizophagus irregularis TaxID=588596 RepID=A0A2I1GJB3_9GLOM|nr:hypothetical protein RhiirA4_461656 [Rhizophagus irregularis]
MYCNLNTICYIDQHNETVRKSSFVVNAMSIVNSQHQNINIYVHIIAFYPKDIIQDNVLEKGVVSDNPDIGDDKITLGLNAREYLDNWDNNSLKILRGSSLYITGYLSIIEDLLIRITQINFIESTHSTSSHKSSGYA